MGQVVKKNDTGQPEAGHLQKKIPFTEWDLIHHGPRCCPETIPVNRLQSEEVGFNRPYKLIKIYA
jgi:hypothetical protein